MRNTATALPSLEASRSWLQLSGPLASYVKDVRELQVRTSTPPVPFFQTRLRKTFGPRHAKRGCRRGISWCSVALSRVIEQRLQGREGQLKINWPVPLAKADTVERGLNERKEAVPTIPGRSQLRALPERHNSPTSTTPGESKAPARTFFSTRGEPGPLKLVDSDIVGHCR